MSTVLESPVEESFDEMVARKQREDRCLWRSILSKLPLVEEEIASAQRKRTDAHAALEAAKAKHDEDVATSNAAERAGEWSMRGIKEAREQLMKTAPEATLKKIAMYQKQLNEVRFINGADAVKQAKFRLDIAEEDYANTRNGDELNILERAKYKLAKLEAEIGDLEAKLNAAITEAIQAE
jgi:hypothetical protein